jgi:hypothetical protein
MLSEYAVNTRFVIVLQSNQVSLLTNNVTGPLYWVGMSTGTR